MATRNHRDRLLLVTWLLFLSILTGLPPVAISSEPEPGETISIDGRISQEIEDFRDWIDNLPEAETTPPTSSLQNFEQQLEFWSQWKRSRSGLARGIQARTGPEHPARQTVETFFEQTTRASELETELVMKKAVPGEDNRKAAEFASTLEELLGAYENLLQLADRLKQYEQLELPAITTVYGPEQVEVQQGDTLVHTYMLETTGAEPTEHLEARVEPTRDPNAGTFSVEMAGLDSIPADKAAVLRLQGRIETAGPVLLRLVVEGSNLEKTKTIAIRGE